MATFSRHLPFTLCTWTLALMSAAAMPAWAMPASAQTLASPSSTLAAAAAAAPASASPSDAPAATVATPQTAPAEDEAITGRERVIWAAESSVGPRSLGVGVLSAAWGVARDSPDEYGANWRGFGKRYAVRLSGVAIGNSIEASAGALWGEDPRYFRSSGGSFWSRVGHAGKATILARRPDGRMRPAYARGLGIVGNNFITNAWRVESDSSTADALTRSAVGLSGRFVSNLFDEFWPDIRRKLRRDPK